MTRLAIGIGCRRGASGMQIADLVRATLREASLSSDGAGLYTIDAKAREQGLSDAANDLTLPLTFLPQEKLATVVTQTISARSLQMFGLGSVAESAALLGAGDGAVLCVPRVARDGVTCAIARALS